jgi:hypothetical protein
MDGRNKNTYNILDRKSEGNSPLGRPMHIEGEII